MVDESRCSDVQLSSWVLFREQAMLYNDADTSLLSTLAIGLWQMWRALSTFYPPSGGGRTKKEAGADAPASRFGSVILLEVTLQHALQSNAVASLVAGHLMDGVVGCVAPPAAPQHFRASRKLLSFYQV